MTSRYVAFVVCLLSLACACTPLTDSVTATDLLPIQESHDFLTVPHASARGRGGDVRVTAARRHERSAKVECVYENTTGSFQTRILIVLEAFDESGRLVGGESKSLVDIPSGSGTVFYLSTPSAGVPTHVRVRAFVRP
jgi:hypothetical protein